MSEESVTSAEPSDESNAKPTAAIGENPGGESKENGTAEQTRTAGEPPVNAEDVSYQAVEKEGSVTAIWEMQGQKHLRTIDPRSSEGKQILALFETAG